MPFRPCTDKERSDLESRIKSVEAEIAERQLHLSRLRASLAEGVWYRDYQDHRDFQAKEVKV